MIKITRLNKSEMVINADLIEHIEATPDTILTLTNSQKIIVRESVDEVVDKVIRYKKLIFQGPIVD